METKLKEIRDYLYFLQGDFESITTNEDLMYQSIRVYQRVRALLNIYQQMVEQNRLFDEDYLKKYLGRQVMTNEELTKEIAKRLNEIRELYLKEYPQGDYMSLTIWKDSILFHNSRWDEDRNFPIFYDEYFREEE